MRQSLANDAIEGFFASKRHPKTDELIKPVGFLPNGRAVWPIMGASPDDPDNDEDEGEENDGGADDSDSDEDNDDEDEMPRRKGNSRVKELSDENTRRRNENKTLKSENDQLKQKLKEIEDKDKSDLERTSSDLKIVTSERDELKDTVHDLLIKNAFLMDNKHNWVKPKTALRLADLSEVEIDDEGNVTGLDKALDALAKSDPYLLKKESDGDEDDDDEPKSTGRPPAKKGNGDPNRNKLVAKYPALRR